VSLTTDQVRLVTQSYALIARSPRAYSELFYHRLLQNHPFARALFPDDMAHQIVIFAKTIDVLVENLANLDRLRPTLSDLARRHVKYGVRADHYSAIGAVLIDTFADILEIGFTPDTRRAWETVYAETAGVMIADAYP
jgi:nitric oxide dioxygenase